MDNQELQIIAKSKAIWKLRLNLLDKLITNLSEKIERQLREFMKIEANEKYWDITDYVNEEDFCFLDPDGPCVLLDIEDGKPVFKVCFEWSGEFKESWHILPWGVVTVDLADDLIGMGKDPTPMVQALRKTADHIESEWERALEEEKEQIEWPSISLLKPFSTTQQIKGMRKSA